MPKRTNDFQRLVHVILGQLAPEGAKVLESALLKETGISIPIEREIDILIDHCVAGVQTRIAVECRDRGRKDDIGWVDCLIGKYSLLPVDKVVAVSSSGMTPSAIEKARLHKIEIRTLKSALKADWKKDFIPLGVGRLFVYIVVKKAAIIAEPPLPEGSDLAKFICTSNGTSLGPASDVLYRLAHGKAQSYVDDNFVQIYRSVADMRKPAQLFIEACPAEGITLVDEEGRAYKLIELGTIVEVRNEFQEGEVKFFHFGSAGVSVGSISSHIGGELKMISVQQTGEPITRFVVERKEEANPYNTNAAPDANRAPRGRRR